MFEFCRSPIDSQVVLRLERIKVVGGRLTIRTYSRRFCGDASLGAYYILSNQKMVRVYTISRWQNLRSKQSYRFLAYRKLFPILVNMAASGYSTSPLSPS